MHHSASGNTNASSVRIDPARGDSGCPTEIQRKGRLRFMLWQPDPEPLTGSHDRKAHSLTLTVPVEAFLATAEIVLAFKYASGF
jgi:hypothetical protein